MRKRRKSLDNCSRATKCRRTKEIQDGTSDSDDGSEPEKIGNSSPESSPQPSPRSTDTELEIDAHSIQDMALSSDDQPDDQEIEGAASATSDTESSQSEDSSDDDDDEYFDCTSEGETTEPETTDSEESNESSSEEDDTADDSFQAEANKPLYHGAPLTVIESVLAILNVCIRFKVSGVLLGAILELICLHCPKPNNCLKTLYKFKKFFAKVELPLKRHFYCCACGKKLEIEFCSHCNSKDDVNYFIEMSIISQIQKMLGRPGFFELLKHRFTRTKKNVNNYEDIYDGGIYKFIRARFADIITNLTLMWNTDGVALFRSSKFNIWPLYLVINELPYSERFKKENVIFAGLWFGYTKPNPCMFLSVFENEMRELYQGVMMKVHGKEMMENIRMMIISGTCDQLAKCLFLNIKQHNSVYGCAVCKIETKRMLTKRRGNKRTYPYKEDLDLRTQEETDQQAADAVNSGEPKCGIKGPSIFRLFVLNYIISTAIDIMHCGYEGVTKQLIRLWFHIKLRKGSGSLFKYLNLINARIRALRPPSFIPRILRPLSEFSYLKANEFKTFLYFCSLPLLCDIMEKPYLEHHILLVLGLTLLNSSSVSEENLEIAKKVLKEYVSRFQILYGIKNCSSNIHLLLHLVDAVRKFGPLWVTSCFLFEGLNGILKSFVHGTRYAQLQIMSAVSNFLSLAELKENYLNKESDVYEFCSKLEKSGTHRSKLTRIKDNLFCVGILEKMKSLSENITNSFPMDIRNKTCYQFKKLIKNKTFYETDSNSQDKSTCSSYCSYDKDGDKKIGKIIKFMRICDSNVKEFCRNCETFAIMEKYEIQPAFYCNLAQMYVPTIFTCRKLEGDHYDVVKLQEFGLVCFHIIVRNTLYVIEPTNSEKTE
ncbi:hypothetical protein QAD02_019650 [Eretmocerus hayati]|uniref:Uncharacterized protein n=1 Tax=Eretmocerus hayati TaxID=131215 RepID=A0ACC2PK70_9HYME|nr:hypothetical protein QAD02_019650 [Eretmocerus hayati]